MKPSQQPGRLRQALRRLRHSERAQGLVEYALIIAVVSVGTIASLTFLRGEILDLFSRAGNALSIGSGSSIPSGPVITITQQPDDPTTSTTATFQFTSSPAATSYQCEVTGTGGSGPAACTPSTNIVYNNLGTGSHTFTVTPTPAGTDGSYTWTINAPPLPNVPTEITPGTWYSPGGDVGGGPDDYQGLDGVYSDNGGPLGAACSFTVNGAPFIGVWIYHSTGPGNDQWTIDGDGGNYSYEWACLQVPAPPVPQPGTASISGPANPTGGDTLTATGTGFTVASGGDSIDNYDFDWDRDGVGTDANCDNVDTWDSHDSDQHNGNTDLTTSETSSTTRYCYRVRIRAENDIGVGPWSAWSASFWVDVPPVPQPGTAGISGLATTGATLTATANGFTVPAGGDSSINRYYFEWGRDDVGTDANCNNASGWNGHDTDDHSGNTDTTTAVNSSANRYCYQVRIQAENDDGMGPWSPWSNPFWVDDGLPSVDVDSPTGTGASRCPTYSGNRSDDWDADSGVTVTVRTGTATSGSYVHEKTTALPDDTNWSTSFTGLTRLSASTQYTVTVTQTDATGHVGTDSNTFTTTPSNSGSSTC